MHRQTRAAAAADESHPTSYRELPLHGLNREYVEALWCFKPPKAEVHRVLPDGRMDLVARFEIAEGGAISNVRLVIAGPAQRPADLPTRDGTAMMGVRFRVGWGGACLGIDPASIRDDTLLADDVLTALGPLAHPILRSTTLAALQDALTCVANSLARRAVPSSQQRQVLDAIALLHRNGGCLPFESLAQLTPMSERSLRRAMLGAVGLAPKTLASIVRFRRTLGLLRSQPGTPLPQIALEGGYSDQAHMTRAFRRLGGFTPAAQPALPDIHLAMV